MVLAEEMVPRDSENPENLDRVASYVSDHFVKAHAAVTKQPFKVKGTTYQNVIASFCRKTHEDKHFCWDSGPA